MQFSWIPSASVKRSKLEGTRHNVVKLHGCYTCKPLLHRGTEGVGSGLPDSLSTTFIFTGNRLVTSIGIYIQLQKSARKSFEMGRPGVFWTDLLILAAWCQPKEERFSIAVPPSVPKLTSDACYNLRSPVSDSLYYLHVLPVGWDSLSSSLIS